MPYKNKFQTLINQTNILSNQLHQEKIGRQQAETSLQEANKNILEKDKNIVQIRI